MVFENNKYRKLITLKEPLHALSIDLHHPLVKEIKQKSKLKIIGVLHVNMVFDRDIHFITFNHTISW